MPMLPTTTDADERVTPRAAQAEAVDREAKCERVDDQADAARRSIETVRSVGREAGEMREVRQDTQTPAGIAGQTGHDAETGSGEIRG